MTAARRRQVLYALLGLAVVWGVYNFKKPRPRDSQPTAAVPAAARAAQPTVGATAQIDVAAASERPWGKDPFRVTPRASNPGAPSQAPSWKLSGILYNDNHPLAIINNRPVGIGGSVDGATVLDINKRQVTLEANGRRFNITVAARG